MTMTPAQHALFAAQGNPPDLVSAVLQLRSAVLATLDPEGSREAIEAEVRAEEAKASLEAAQHQEWLATPEGQASGGGRTNPAEF